MSKDKLPGKPRYCSEWTTLALLEKDEEEEDDEACCCCCCWLWCSSFAFARREVEGEVVLRESSHSWNVILGRSTMVAA